MIQSRTHEKWAEVYAVEKTVEVVVSMQGEPQTIRIEALRSFQTGRYSTKAFCLQHAVLQPVPPPEHEEEADKAPEEAPPQPIYAPVWADLRPTLNMTNEASADEAIERALDYLAQRCD